MEELSVGVKELHVGTSTSVQAVLDALYKATTQNPELLNAAENQLRRWRTEPGFYSVLLNIAFDQNIDINFRWLAILCSKNGLDNECWRNVITDDEKCAIRHKLLLSLCEPSNQIALQLSLIIAKVAHYDFPNWQELFPTLINGIQSKEELPNLRSLLILCHVVKIFAPTIDCEDSSEMVAPKTIFSYGSSEKFASTVGYEGHSEMFASTIGCEGDSNIFAPTIDCKGDSEMFEQIAQTLFSTILNQWINSSTSFIDTLQTDVAKASPLLEGAFLNLKMLRHLSIGFKDISKQPDVLKFLDFIFKQIKPFLECRLALINIEHDRQICEKYLVLLVKVLINVKKCQPLEYAPFIQSSLECGVMYCFNSNFQNYVFEGFIVKFINLLTEITQKRECLPIKYKYHEQSLQILDQINKTVDSFFSHSVLSEIFQQLVSRYFPLTEEELCCWKNDPEEFAIQDRSLWVFPELHVPGRPVIFKEKKQKAMEVSLRPSVEDFFVLLVKAFDSTIEPIIFEAVKSIEVSDVNSAMDVLKKDALYLVVGLTASRLFDRTKFNELFSNFILPELQNKSNDYYVIRRRIAWLISHCARKFSSEVKTLLFDRLKHCMVKEEDLVVRLTAANSFKSVIVECFITDNLFFSFVEDWFFLLFQLILDVEELNIKLLVLSALNHVLAQNFHMQDQHIHHLVNYLARLWNQCGDNNLLRCTIISCFKQLVQFLQKESEKLHPILLPIITFSTDLTQPFYVYLLEDALSLWYSVMRYTLTCSADLMNTSINLMSLLEHDDENLEICLKIIEVYILLAPEECLKRYGQDFIRICESAVRNLKHGRMVDLFRMIEVFLVVLPQDAPVHFQPLLLIVLDLLLHYTKKWENFLPITLSLFLYVILNNKPVFAHILLEKAAESQTNANIILGELLNVCLLCISHLSSELDSEIIYKKLIALVLSSLLTSGFEIVYTRFASILYAVVEVINDLTIFPFLDKDYLVRFTPEARLQVEDKIHYLIPLHKLKTNLEKHNPIYYIKLRGYFLDQMKALEHSVGTSKYEELMATVDIKAKEQITKYLQA